jgi:hypothetical protein
MGKDWRQLLPPHLDLHLEVFVPKKKEVAENITAGSRNLKTQNLRISSSGVSPNPHQRHPLIYVMANFWHQKKSLVSPTVAFFFLFSHIS